MQYEDLTHKIIGAAMKIHSKLGCGFPEVIYQRALAIEMEKQALNFSKEIEMTIYYDDIAIGKRRVDFFVQDKIIVELKATSKLEDLHLAQAVNYLEAYNLPIGLLINFGSKAWNLRGFSTLNILIILITKTMRKHLLNKSYNLLFLKILVTGKVYQLLTFYQHFNALPA